MRQKSVEKLISSTLAGYYDLLSLDGESYSSKFSGEAVSLEIETPINVKGKIEPVMAAYLSYEFKYEIDIDTKIEENIHTSDFTPEKVEESHSLFEKGVDHLENRIKERAECELERDRVYSQWIKLQLIGIHDSIKRKDKNRLKKNIEELCESVKWDNAVELGKLYDTFSVLKKAAKHYASVIDDFNKIYTKMRSAEKPIIRFCRENGLFVPKGIYRKGIDHKVISEAIIGNLVSL